MTRVVMINDIKEFAAACISHGLKETELAFILFWMNEVTVVPGSPDYYKHTGTWISKVLEFRDQGRPLSDNVNYLESPDLSYSKLCTTVAIIERLSKSIEEQFPGNIYKAIGPVLEVARRRMRAKRAIDMNNAWTADVPLFEFIDKATVEELVTIFHHVTIGSMTGSLWHKDFLNLTKQVGGKGMQIKDLNDEDVLYHDLIAIRECMLNEHGNISNRQTELSTERMTAAMATLGAAMHYVEDVMKTKKRIDPKWGFERLIRTQISDKGVIEFFFRFYSSRRRLKIGTQAYAEEIWEKRKNFIGIPQVTMERSSFTRRNVKMIAFMIGDFQHYLQQMGINNLAVQRALITLREIDKKKAKDRH